MAWWTLDWMLERKGDAKTPLAIKIGAPVHGLLSETFLGDALKSENPTRQAVAILLLAAACAACVGLWNLKKWAMVVFAAQLGLYLIFAVPYVLAVGAWGSLAFGTALRCVGPVLGVIYWRKLTWR